MISEKTFLRLLNYEKINVQKEYKFKTKNKTMKKIRFIEGKETGLKCSLIDFLDYLKENCNLSDKKYNDIKWDAYKYIVGSLKKKISSGLISESDNFTNVGFFDIYISWLHFGHLGRIIPQSCKNKEYYNIQYLLDTPAEIRKNKDYFEKCEIKIEVIS